MALGNTNNQDNKYQLIILRPSFPKDGNGKPAFTVVKKEGGAYVQMADTVEKFTANLTKIKLGDLYDTQTERGRENAAKFGNSKVVNLTFVDEQAGEQYLVKFSFRLYTRAFFNALLNIQGPENLQVSLWQDQKTKHNRISLRQNGELVRWKYELSEVPAPEETKNARGVVVDVDYSAVDNFFYEKLEEFSQTLFSSTEKEEKKPALTKATAQKSESKTQKFDSEDEIPF